MEKVSNIKLRDKIIKHLLDNDYNLHQHATKLNFYFAYTPYGKRLIFSFNVDSIQIIELLDLKNTIIRDNKKILPIINRLNEKSIRMKFSIDKDYILSMESRLQNIYNRKQFQIVLDDIEYDTSELYDLIEV